METARVEKATVLLEAWQPRPMADKREAKRIQRIMRELHGFKGSNPALLTPPDANHKLELGMASGSVAFGLSLAPADESGFEMCAWRTPDCTRGCLKSAGNGRWDSNTRARIAKACFLMSAPEAFLRLLVDEIATARAKYGARLAIRLNVFSDLRWERFAAFLFEQFPDVQFYDYSKGWGRVGKLPANYHLTWSVSELTSEQGARNRVAMGENVAVVFSASRSKPLPATWAGLAVHDGDGTDARYHDPKGVVVGLRAKGDMRRPGFAMVRG